MVDNLSPEHRHRCMARIRTKDTDLERAVRSSLFRRGLRFRKHVRTLPGKPDVVFPRARVAVFVDGDFWHGYQFRHWENGLSEFWRRKIRVNRERDLHNFLALRAMGWRVVRVWQHEVEDDLEECTGRIVRAIAESRASHGLP